MDIVNKQPGRFVLLKPNLNCPSENDINYDENHHEVLSTDDLSVNEFNINK